MVGPRLILLGPKNGFTVRLSAGAQSHWARPIMATSNEMDTTSLVASLVPSSPRMMTRSSRIPKAGASTPSTISKASGAGQPHPTRSCQ